MREVFGISFNEENRKSFDELFTLVRDLDEESYYETKKTYHHEEDGLTFDYKYVVNVCCFEDECCDGALSMGVNLYIAPTFDSFCDKTKLEMVSVWGIDTIEQLNEERGNGGEVSCGEVVEEGYGICLGGLSYKAPNGWKDLDKDELDNVASVVDAIDSFFGFYVDKPWNRIGTTGWDTLKHDINGETLFKFDSLVR